MFVVFFSPLFSTLGCMVLGGKRESRFFFVSTPVPILVKRIPEPPIPTIISSSTERASEVLGVAERGEGDATWLQMMLRCNQKKRWQHEYKLSLLRSEQQTNLTICLGANISHQKFTFESMIFLFPRWDMLVPWRVFVW